jgi:hypothetical protein
VVTETVREKRLAEKYVGEGSSRELWNEVFLPQPLYRRD